MKLPITSSLGLSGLVVLTMLKDIGPLTLAYLVPGAASGLMQYFDVWLAARFEVSNFMPNWLNRSLTTFFDAIIFVSIIRYLVMGDQPIASFRRLKWIPVIATTLIWLVLWSAIDAVAGRQALYTAYYSTYFADAPISQLPLIHFILGMWEFLVSILAVAIIYPILGQFAVTDGLDMAAMKSWYRYSLTAILIYVALLTATIELTSQLYWQLLDNILPPNIWDKPMSYSNFDGRTAAFAQALRLPVDYLYTVLPAVAVGLLVGGLQGKKSDPSATAVASPARR